MSASPTGRLPEDDVSAMFDTVKGVAERHCAQIETYTATVTKPVAILETQEILPGVVLEMVKKMANDLGALGGELFNTSVTMVQHLATARQLFGEGTAERRDLDALAERVQAESSSFMRALSRTRSLLELEDKADGSALFEMIRSLSTDPDSSEREWGWDIAIRRYRTRPHEARFRDADHGGPLHVVVAEGGPLRVVRAICEAYPAAAVLQNERNGCTPLLAAATDVCSDEVFAYLLERSVPPTAAEIEGVFKDAGLPSLTCSVIQELVLPMLGEPLLFRSVSGIGIVPDGGTVLHHMVHFGQSPLDRVRAVIRLKPQALSVVDENGDTPLHRACQDNRSSPSFAPIEVLRFVAESFPEAKSMENDDGMTPLQVAQSYRETSQNQGRLSILTPA